MALSKRARISAVMASCSNNQLHAKKWRFNTGRCADLLMRDVVLNGGLQALANALGGDGAEVAGPKDRVNDHGIGCLYFWWHCNDMSVRIRNLWGLQRIGPLSGNDLRAISNSGC